MNLQHSPEFPELFVRCECRSESADRNAAGRMRWYQALGLFASPAVRLHRMRDVHTRMLHDALCLVDYDDRPGKTP